MVAHSSVLRLVQQSALLQVAMVEEREVDELGRHLGGRLLHLDLGGDGRAGSCERGDVGRGGTASRWNGDF